MSDLAVRSSSYEVVTGADALEFLNALNVGNTTSTGPRRRSLTLRKYPYLQWRALNSDQPEVDKDIVGLRGYLLEVGYRFEQRPYSEDGQNRVLCYSRQCTIGGQQVVSEYPFPYPIYAPMGYVRSSNGSPLPASQVRQLDPRAQRLQPVGSNPDRGRTCAECVAQGNHVYIEERNGERIEVVCGGTGYVLFCVVDVAVQRGTRQRGQIVYTNEFVPIEEYEYLGERPFRGPVLLKLWIGRQLALRRFAVDFKRVGMPEDLVNLDRFLQQLRSNPHLVRPVKRRGCNHYQLQYQPAVELYMVPILDNPKIAAVPMFRVAPEIRPFPEQEGSDVRSWLDLAWHLLDTEEPDAYDDDFGDELLES